MHFFKLNWINESHVKQNMEIYVANLANQLFGGFGGVLDQAAWITIEKLDGKQC